MKPLSSLGYFNLTMLAKPACDRQIFKVIRKNKFRSIVEVGMGDGTRVEKMIRVARKFAISPSLRYTGVDSFDARATGDPLPLIKMHRKLNFQDVKTQLVPGNLASAIARIANSHVRTDLIVISSGYSESDLESSWFYMPRMLHSSSLVLVQSRENGEFKSLNRLQIEKLADNRQDQRSIAA